MTKQKSTKRALLSSAIALFVCVAMLIGTTFAWFTDSVTSKGNKIQAGTLKIDLLELVEKNGSTEWESIKDSNKALFNYDKWEPGYTDVTILKITNEGTLSLKWMAKFVSSGELSELANVIDVYVKEDVTAFPADRADLSGWTKAGTVKDFVNTIETTTVGTLMPKGSAGDAETLGIALKMQETAGNDYQEKTLGAFDIQIVATQLTYEKDSFNDQYDKDATYPLGKNTVVSKEYTEAEHNVDFKATVAIPAEAPDGKYDIVLSEPEEIEYNKSNGNGSIKFDLSLTRTVDGVTEKAPSGVAYEVTIELPHPFVDITEIIHNSVKIADYDYIAETNSIKFTTTHFSPFEIKYKDFVDSSYDLEYKYEDNKYTITGGMFVEMDPAEFDASLASNDSKYMRVPYTKDGKTYYVVSERATTVIVAADDTSIFLNGKDEAYFADHIKKNSSGKLWSIISGLQNNEFSTVYILPGTYNEGTTINVYSSMDIIGLGDKDSVKIVKTSSSSSNRHLFNCNGTKADYIEVTIRNLHLDATAKTTNNKDNAAVQSIRKTKVKCYDLTIVKGTGWDAVAFYVNGNNAVDGVKYPAYLYAENCNLNTTRSFGVVTTSGSYKFYHSNLTYNGTLYTNNSGSIKNITMDRDDWEW